MLEYRVLGPLMVLVDGRPMKLGGRRPQLVLATLLSHANRTVSQEALIDSVWAGDPPEAAKSTLQSYIYGLRRALGVDSILRSGEGYRVEVDVDSLDSMRFDDLLFEARGMFESDLAGAADLLTQALALWRGSPYEGLESNPTLLYEITRLEELHLAATELRNDAELELGHHGALIGELDVLVRRHPLRERFRAQQMLALYRGGRQAEALRAYQGARAQLGEELGIEPSFELQDLEQRILEHDPSLDLNGNGHRGPPLESRAKVEPLRGYQVKAVVGSGDFGTVYSAVQPTIQREVAVKVVRPEYAGTSEFVRRFEQEAQTVAQLDHPHIVPLYDFWRDPDGAYLVMPLMRGGSLESAIDGGGWSLPRVLTVVDQVSGALAHAHRRGVAHRDLKPANVLLDSDGNAYLADFGIARTSEGGLDSIGIGDDHPSPDGEFALDISALGGIAFRLLTGVAPNGWPLAPLVDARPDLPPELGRVIATALESDPAQRYRRVDDFIRDFKQSLGADVVMRSPDSQADPEPIRNPYKGLSAFRDSDAADFFGREALVEELVEAVSGHNVVVVAGPSGCGKSSVVRAGLVPALRGGALAGSGQWLLTDMFPGSHPFEELEGALLKVAVDHPSNLLAELADENGLLRVTKRILPTEDTTLLLVVDQFEELFSMVRSESSRLAFLDNLVAVASDERSRVKVVLTLRADFLDRPLAYHRFAEVLGRGLVTVGPPSRDGLAQAIAAPARAVGVETEPGLIGRIVADVENQPAALPLLQFAMTQLFADRNGSYLSIRAYEEMGGVQGALGLRAEELFDDLPESTREATRQIFLRLVSVAEGNEPIRRRVPQSELRGLSIDESSVDQVLGRFGRLRLVSFDRDPRTRTPTVELAHEALLSEWSRLRGWIDEQREALIVARRISELSREWVASGYEPSFLLRGARLRQAESFVGSTELAVTEDEALLIATSLEAEELENQAVRRRRHALTLSLAAALGVFVVLSAAALWQWDSARDRARQIVVNDLAVDAIAAIDKDPELALLLAVESAEVSANSGEPLAPAARSALLEALHASRLEILLGGALREIEFAESTIVAITSSGDLAAYSLLGAPLWSVEDGSHAHAIVASPAGDLVAVAHRSADVEKPSRIVVLDVVTRDEVAVHLVSSEPLDIALDWSADGRWIAVTAHHASSAEISLLDLVAGEMGDPFTVDGAHDVVVFDDGSVAVSRPDDGQVSFHDGVGTSAGPALELPGFAPGPLAHDPAGSRLVLGSIDAKRVQVWDLTARQMLWEETVPHPADSPIVLDVSSESEVVAVAAGGGTVTLFDLAKGTERLTLRGHVRQVTDVAFDAAGTRVATTAQGESGRVWNVTSAGVGTVSAGPAAPCGLSVFPDGSRVAITGTDGTFSLVDIADLDVLQTIPGQGIHFGALATFSGDFERMSWVDHDDVGRVWDVATGQRVTELPPCHLPKALNHDGTLLVADVGCGDERSGSLIDTSTGAEVVDLGQGEIWEAFFVSGGGIEPSGYLVLNRHGMVEIRDLEGERLSVIQLPSDELIDTIAVDRKGLRLASGSQTGMLSVYSLPDLIAGSSVEEATIQTVQTPGNISGIAIEGDHVAVSDHGVLRVWDVNSGVLLVEPPVEINTPPFSAFTPDGRSLIYADGEYSVRTLILDGAELVQHARERLTRDFTKEECLTYLGSDCGLAEASALRGS